MSRPPVCPGCGHRFSARLPRGAAAVLCFRCACVLSVTPDGALRLPDTAEWDRLLRRPDIAAEIQRLRHHREHHRR